MWGMPIFSTAGVLSALSTAATYEQLGSSPCSGTSGVRFHLRSSSCTVAGKRSSHAARSGVLRQLASSAHEILVAIIFIVAMPPFVRHLSGGLTLRLVGKRGRATRN